MLYKISYIGYILFIQVNKIPYLIYMISYLVYQISELVYKISYYINKISYIAYKISYIFGLSWTFLYVRLIKSKATLFNDASLPKERLFDKSVINKRLFRLSHTALTHRPFSVFSAGLPVSRCVTSQDTNIKEPAFPVYGTVPFICSLVLSSILFVWKKCFCVKKWSRNISYLTVNVA